MKLPLGTCDTSLPLGQSRRDEMSIENIAHEFSSPFMGGTGRFAPKGAWGARPLHRAINISSLRDLNPVLTERRQLIGASFRSASC